MSIFKILSIVFLSVYSHHYLNGIIFRYKSIYSDYAKRFTHNLGSYLVDMYDKRAYSKWIFAQGYQNYNHSLSDNNRKKEIIVSDTLVEGIHVPKSYKTRFTLDMVSGNLQINNVFVIVNIHLDFLLFFNCFLFD